MPEMTVGDVFTSSVRVCAHVNIKSYRTCKTAPILDGISAVKTPSAKTNQNAKSSKKGKISKPKTPFRPAPAAKAGSGNNTVRMRGQHAIIDVESNANDSVYIDRTYLQNANHSVPLLAANFGLYEQYFVHGVELEFIPSVAVTEAGTIHMAPDYDPTDLFPTSSSSMSSSKGYVSGPISLGLRCKMPNTKALDNSYVRPVLYTSPSADERCSCYGSFRIIATGTTAIVGRVILHYDISFTILEPQQIAAIATDITSIRLPVAEDYYLKGDDTQSSAADRPYFQKDGPHTVELGSGSILSAIVGKASTALLKAKGRSVLPGTRIFVRPAHKLQTVATGVTTQVHSSPIVGSWNLSKSFDAISEVMFRGAADSLINLLDATLVYSQ